MTWPLMLRKVHGHSMVPVLPPGTMVFGFRWFHKLRPGKVIILRLSPGLWDEFDVQTVQENRSLESIPVPLEAQGGAFDRQGNLWVSASGPKFGRLYRLDRKGNVQAQYEMVAGLEDLAVDESGRLWGLSESGTRKYMHWDTHYPFIFRIDTARLK